MPTPPYEAPLNLAMRTLATCGLWALTALLLAYAVRRSLRERSPLGQDFPRLSP